MEDIREDSYVNLLMGIGSALTSGLPLERSLASVHLDRLYQFNPFAAKIVDLPVEGMTKVWVKYRCTESAPEVVQQVQEKLDEAIETYIEALTLARLYGGSAILLGADDGEIDWSVPLNERSLTSLDFLNIADCRYISPSEYSDNIFQADYGKPKYYNIGSKEKIHHSRILRFDGVKLSRHQMRAKGGWGESVLTRPYQQLIDFLRSHEGVFASVKDFNQRVLKLKDLVAKLAAPGGRQRVEEMVQAKARVLDALGMMALDADNEDYGIVARQYQGVLDVLKQAAQIFAGAVDFPPSKLLSLFASPGLASEDTTQERAWADYIAGRQKTDLLKQVQRHLRIIHLCRNSPTGGVIPKGVELEFPSIFQLSQKEEMALKLDEAKRHDVYLKYQVVSPEEVAESLARNVPIESVIDLRSRVGDRSLLLNFPEGQYVKQKQ